MWYAKMYFSEGREIFQYDSLGMQGVPDVQKEFPFLESLLAFQELDCAEVTPILQSITDNWSRFISTYLCSLPLPPVSDVHSK